jgi:hypothetical protein
MVLVIEGLWIIFSADFAGERTHESTITPIPRREMRMK